MADITVSDLQSMAVQATSDFYNRGISLSEGIAKMASDRGLNPEQIKRTIEATNTLAHLKSVDSGDRTGEFQVADFNDIVKFASLPEDMMCDMTMGGCKPAAPTQSDVANMYLKSPEDQGFSPANLEDMPELSKTASMQLLVKEAARNKRALEAAEAKAFHLTLDLEKTASELRKLPYAVEAMSHLANQETFVKLARLTFGMDSDVKRIDWAEEVTPQASWKPALQKAAALNILLNEAGNVIREVNHRSGLDKQAGLLTNAAAGVARAAMGVVKAPFKMVGSKIANGVSAGIDNAATKVQTGFAGTTMGKSMGVQPGVLKPSTVKTMANSKRALGVATLGIGAGTDMLAFSPKNDPSKGSNGDVWDALN